MSMTPRRRYVRQSLPAPFDPKAPRYYVYRLLNANGDVLYIGRSRDPRRRLADHRRVSAWALEVVDMEIAGGPYTWSEVIAAERAAIEAERPPHNKMHAA